MMHQPVISVIIPAYNAAEVLPHTLNSVLAQTFDHWELIVIDDGSTDETAQVVREYQKRDRRIHLISQPNQGVSASRNRGVDVSQGDLLAFLDADDLWHPTKLQQHWQHFQFCPQLGVSFARVGFLTPSGQPTRSISRLNLEPLQPTDLLCENPTTTTSNWVVRRIVFEQVGGFRPHMSYAEDLEWLLRVACFDGWQLRGLPDVLTFYRTSNQGLSSNLYRMEAGWQALVQEAQRYAPTLIQQQYPRAQAIHLRYLARRALRLGVTPTVGADFMTRALKSDAWTLTRSPHRTLPTLVLTYLRLLKFHLKSNRTTPSKLSSAIDVPPQP